MLGPCPWISPFFPRPPNYVHPDPQKYLSLSLNERNTTLERKLQYLSRCGGYPGETWGNFKQNVGKRRYPKYDDEWYDRFHWKERWVTRRADDETTKQWEYYLTILEHYHELCPETDTSVNPPKIQWEYPRPWNCLKHWDGPLERDPARWGRKYI